MKINKDDIGFYLFKWFWYLVIFTGIGISACFNGKIIESIFVFVSYLSLRYAFPKTYHDDNFYMCVFWSITIFWIAIPNTLPKNLSLLSSIIVGMLITFVLYKVEDYVEIKLELKRFKDKTIYAMNEQELYDLCRNRGLDDVECKIAKFVIIDRLKGKELANAIGYSEVQTKRKRKKILNALK